MYVFKLLLLGFAWGGAMLLLTGCGGSKAADDLPCAPVTMGSVGDVQDGILLAADASSPTGVWAVGSSEHLSPSQAAVALRWDGNRWTRTTVGGVETLIDVAAIGPRDVWAIGTRGVDEQDWLGHWDGANWLEVPPPPRWKHVNSSAIDAVSADDVWLVGTDFGTTGSAAAPYIAHWDGEHWSLSGVNRPSGLLKDISAFSADSVWAVGYASLDEYDQETGTLVLRWNGETWLEIATPPEIDGLDNITATTRNEAWVVPDYFSDEPSPLWRWDGSEWMQELSPLHDISAMSAFDGDLWAAGTGGVPEARIVNRFDDGEWEPASITGTAATPDYYSEGFIGFVAVSNTTAWGVGRAPIASRACIG